MDCSGFGVFECVCQILEVRVCFLVEVLSLHCGCFEMGDWTNRTVLSNCLEDKYIHTLL
jgi:hypothetical protein